MYVCTKYTCICICIQQNLKKVIKSLLLCNMDSKLSSWEALGTYEHNITLNDIVQVMVLATTSKQTNERTNERANK